MERDKDWCERSFKYVFHFLCGVATVGFTIYCVHQYIKDEDVARIEFAEFNAEEDNIYPTITLCFPSPLIEEKLSSYGEGITVETYSAFLTGQNNSWDERMAKIDYDDVSINIEDYFLGFEMFETTTWTKFKYKHHPPWIEPDLNTTGWPPNFYISERGLFGKCWSVDIPYMPKKTIHSFGIMYSTDIFPNNIRPQKYGFGIILHYPRQLSRADFGTYEWKSQDKNPPDHYTMRYKIENTMVLKRRNKAKSPCNANWKEDDTIIYQRIFERAQCKPPYWKMDNNGNKNLKNCTSDQEVGAIFQEAINIKTSPFHPPPCQQLEKMIYIYDEFDWLVDDWILDGSNSTQKSFEILLEFFDGTYMAIQQAKAYDGQSLVGNAGGYIGLFLGYSLLNAFLMLPKVGKRCYTTVIQTLSHCVGFEQKSFNTDTTGFHLTNGQICKKKRSNSRKSESHLNMSDGHLSIEIGDIENIATVDQQSSKELLNDIICDNIVLKNKLDKVVGETKTLRQSLEEIGSRVKEINDVCDILVSEKLKSDENSCVKSNRSQNSTSKVKRVFV